MLYFGIENGELQEYVDASGNVQRRVVKKDVSALRQDMTTYNLADFYALEWRNRSMMGLEKRSFQGATVGLHFLAGFMPIPSAAISFSKYKHMSREDSELAKQRAKHAEYT